MWQNVAHVFGNGVIELTESFEAVLGALYRSKILYILPASVHHTTSMRLRVLQTENHFVP